ncbi:MAG: hypothetical protein WCD54_14530 [Pseudolabrys sp.]
MSLVGNRFQLTVDKCGTIFCAHQNGDLRDGYVSMRRDGNDLILAPYKVIK